jgi:hypothetical protein
MASEAGPLMRTRARGSPSWPRAIRPEAGYVFADCQASNHEATCRRGGPYVFAATDALSRLARLQSKCPASDRRSSSTRCSAAQTPASCQSRNRRQQVMPEQPSSRGSISQGMPERSTKMMPARVSRLSQRGRPTLRLGRLYRQERLDHRPEVVGDMGLAHTPPTLKPQFC